MSCTTWPRRTLCGLQWPLANPAREDLPAQRNVGKVFATPKDLVTAPAVTKQQFLTVN